MEDYKEKYQIALNRAELCYDNYSSQTKDIIGYIFPELKESEDERVKKRILLSLEKDLMATKNSGCDTQDLEQCIAWLEKQGDQKPVIDFKAKNWYVSKVDGKIHDMTYNPTDKVEPKFKVGDFIVYDYCMGKVVEITNDAYLLDIGQGIPFSCEDNVHLWTIKDANEGNILAGKIDGDNYIFIFKTIKDGWIETYGHYYNAVNRFCVPSQLFCRDYQGTFTPATKEQRDTLMKAMVDAGYEWNAEKKELKKVEDEIEIPFGAKDSELQEETYYIPKGFHAEIEADKVVIKKGEKPATWSDEDEKMYINFKHLLDQEKSKFSYTTAMYNGIVLMENWLKSLKDRIGG